MATVVPNTAKSAHAAGTDHGPAKPASRRGKTSHLKVVPEARTVRQQIRRACDEAARQFNPADPPGKQAIEAVARQLLAERSLPEGYVGWTMVMLASSFWRERIIAAPYSRRLLLLPDPRHGEGCPSADSQKPTCLSCRLAQLRSMALRLGYQILPAENSPLLLEKIVGGQIDAIVGVADLNLLEKAIDKVLLIGLPCMAVPLLSAEPTTAAVDDDWVVEMIGLEHQPSAMAQSWRAPSYVHLMRAASGMFQNDELYRLAPRLHGGASLAQLNGHGLAGVDPIAGTETIAYDFLVKGGKHSRPFITLAVYDAMTGGRGAAADGAEAVAQLPDAVRRAALSIEIFHKASLVHDDIEDDDQFRYGDRTLHRKFGTATAINVGDYLIGLGYRLVSRETATLGAEVTADILDRLAEAHMKLAEGQGAELLWRDSRDKRLTAADALRIYALKTAPAFEAALHAGLRMAGPLEVYLEPVPHFARHLGIAFQILNDLADWQGDNFNKLIAGGDALGGRPTLLWALALEACDAGQLARLTRLADADQSAGDGVARLQEIRQIYQSAGVFQRAERLVEQHQQQASAVADAIQPVPLMHLFHFLIEMVLARPTLR